MERTSRRVNNFADLLSRAEKAIASDKLTFESLKKKHITLDEAWEQFLDNNHYSLEDFVWDKETKGRFIGWLNGLGWCIRLKVNDN